MVALLGCAARFRAPPVLNSVALGSALGGLQLALQGHAQSMPHTTAAASMCTSLALQHGCHQWAAWLACDGLGLHGDRCVRFMAGNKTARCLRIAGRRP